MVACGGGDPMENLGYGDGDGDGLVQLSGNLRLFSLMVVAQKGYKNKTRRYESKMSFGKVQFVEDKTKPNKPAPMEALQ
ncbi:unnamed protein product [Sphenostylis stenocarpa]|uniref:Uncharacterized protein n=1 Tax=Sphenostylis stenocarpa TaxID=92480 RepID=A0AA86S7V1_9FABA|nr:unnamed protein product [Sphenostylis stenocarpa]